MPIFNSQNKISNGVKGNNLKVVVSEAFGRERL